MTVECGLDLKKRPCAIDQSLRLRRSVCHRSRRSYIYIYVYIHTDPNPSPTVDHSSSFPFSSSSPPTMHVLLPLGVFTTIIGAYASPVATDERQLQKRYDDRSLIGFPSQNGTAFCQTWIQDCQTYRPSNPDLRLISAHCTPGDYRGQHPDTRALVWCEFGTYTSVLKHVRLPVLCPIFCSLLVS